MLSFSLLPMQNLYGAGFEPGHLIVGTYQTDNSGWQSFWDVDPQTGDKELLAKLPIGYRNDGIAVTKEGRLFLAQDQVWRVLEILPDSGTYKTVATIQENLRDLKEGPNGALWVLSGNSLRLLQQNTGQTLINYPSNAFPFDNPTDPFNPFDIALRRDGSILKSYVTHIDDSDGSIVQIDPATGIEQTLVASLDNPGALCPDPAGNLYLLDQRYADNYSRLLRIDGQTGQVTELRTIPVSWTNDLVRGSDGCLYWSQTWKTDGIRNSDIYSWDMANQPILRTTFTGEYIMGMTVVPVPEPATIGLLALGGLAMRRRR